MEISKIISIFMTLFLVVDPLGLLPVFIIYLSGNDAAKRKKIIFKSISIAIAVSFIFIFLGKFILKYLGISPEAFLIAGGILLFMISFDMIFARPSRTKLTDDDVNEIVKEDVSVFPLAIPMISGPGNIAALIMFSSQVNDNIYMLFTIALISVSIFFITMIVMLLSVHIEKLLRETGISVTHRIMGLILTALSVQFIINGLKQIQLN